LNFFEKPVAGLHIDEYQSWSLNSDKLVLLAKNTQLTSRVQLEVIADSSYDLHRGRVGSQTLEPKFDCFSGAERFLDEV
jgi:hypothetical protein